MVLKNVLPLLFSQIGPEKGVVHLAVAAVINALWDLWAKVEGKVSFCVDWLC